MVGGDRWTSAACIHQQHLARAAAEGRIAHRRQHVHYARPDLLVIDEVGYLSYSNRQADLLFELISRRYQNKSTVVATNKSFDQWHEVFPSAGRKASKK